MARKKKTVEETTPAADAVEVADGGDARLLAVEQVDTDEDGATRPAEADQFPAVTQNDPELEIAKRSPDRVATRDERYRKVFVVPLRQFDENDEHMHARNKLATLQEAIQNGVHPTGAGDLGGVTFDGHEPTPYGGSVALSYSVGSTPASVDENANEANAPFGVLTDELDGTTDTVKDDTSK